jgi:surface antigen
MRGGGIMYRKIVSIVVMLTFIAGIMGCTTFGEEHKGAATGAGAGAVVGATAGALLGSKGAKTEMAIIGGLLGALAGGLIGHYAYDQKRTESETAKAYHYNSSQGAMLRIESASVEPKTVNAGETVEIKMTYALLGAGSSGISLSEVREIRYNGELFAKPQVNVTRENGTYSSTIPITLPADAKKGKYSVIMTVQAANVSDSKEATFYVD